MTKSILYGRDTQVIPLLLNMHCPVEQPKILDVTHNQGVMWKGLSYNLTTMDINPAARPDVVGDFRAIPFDDASFDVIVFDPPHLPMAAASTNASGIYEEQYGITAKHTEHANHIGGYFLPFLKEAKRVLRQDGIILAKIADIIHNHRYQWHHILFINAVLEVGMTPCDLLVKVDPSGGNLQSSKWVNQHHLRNAHCYWIVVRNSDRCEGSRCAERPVTSSHQLSIWS